MTSDIRRHWQAALAVLLIWGSAGFLGSVGQAADGDPATASDPQSQAIADRLDAMLERAAARIGPQEAGEAEPETDEALLREQLEEADTQIKLLKNVVIQALRAQSAAEEALRRERGAGTEDEAGSDLAGSPDLMLTEQVEALTESVRRLRADVDALQAESSGAQMTEPDAERSSAAGDAEAEVADAPVEDDALLPGAGMGGEYQPLLEDEPPASGRSPASGRGDVAAVGQGDPMSAGSDPVEVAEVHFNTGSAELTPGGERRAREAAERVKSMDGAKVRVVGYTDRVGDAAYNLVLSKERALAIAAVLESVGLARDMVEVVGKGEDDIPVPTADGVPEPLNRRAGVFVVPASAG